MLAGDPTSGSAGGRLRLAGLLALVVGILLSVGLGALLARTSELTHALARTASGISRHAPVGPELAPLPARLLSAPLPNSATTPGAVRTVPVPSVPTAERATSTTSAPPVPARVEVQIMPAALPPGWSCAAALTYLRAHAAPGFSFVCPGYAYGHQAMTCDDVARICPGYKIIVIADPCPAAYENEAWNSRVFEGLASGPLDPYGYCPR